MQKSVNKVEMGEKCHIPNVENLRRGATMAKLLHCMRIACILRTQRPGYSPKNTCHLTGCIANQQRGTPLSL